LKGALRAYAEAVLRALGGAALSCDPLVDPCIAPEEVTEIKETRGMEADTVLWARTCWACRLFGAPWLASRVQVKDLTVTEAWVASYGHRDGVSIDRDTGTARDKKRYTFEVVPKGTAFGVDLLVTDVDDALLGLLLLTLEGVNHGYILLGGARSRGLGGVTLTMAWDAVEDVDPEAMTSSEMLTVLGARAVGDPVPTTAWSLTQRERWITTFFEAVGLPADAITRWREARRAQEEGHDDA
jgi:CRISPR-associated RAMP protein (TIGR02581 family)